MKFIDLFAGLGGFHLALANNGHECVFASEIDPDLRKCYESNFGIKPAGDIREIDIESIPKHDILTAGIPCQPFSLGGIGQGLDDARGTMIYDIYNIINCHKPKYFIIENVPRFLTMHNGAIWKYIRDNFSELDYNIDYLFLSPHQIGIPQTRKRLFIIGALHGSASIHIENIRSPDIMNFLDSNPTDAKSLSEEYRELLDYWQIFINEYGVKARYTYINNYDNYYANKIKAFKKYYHTLIYSERDDLNFNNRPVMFVQNGVYVFPKGLAPTVMANPRKMIVNWERRWITLREEIRLQSLQKLKYLPEYETYAHKAVGNAVNVSCVEKIIEKLI